MPAHEVSGPGEPTMAWRRARELVLQHGWNATAYQILNPGMSLWFSPSGDAVAGFAVHGNVRVVAGAPICPAVRLHGAATELEADARRCGQRVVFFGAGSRLEQALAAEGAHCLVTLGAQPVWDPRGWDAIVAGKASLRAQLHRARNKGVVVERWSAAAARESAAVHRVLLAWLAARGLPPLGFMTTPTVLERGDERRVYVACRGRERRVVAYLVATPVPARDGWLVEQWPRSPEAPNGTMQLLVDAAMRDFAAEASPYATLGLAPLSGKGGAAAPRSLWLRWTLRWLRAHGRRFYNFRGLEAFKDALQPDRWEPVYAIAPGRRFTPRLLHAIAGVFSRGSPELLIASALLHAARAELARVTRRVRP